MNLIVKSTAKDTMYVCNVCKSRAELCIHANLETTVPYKQTVSQRMFFCYNCINTAMVDAIGHGIATDFNSTGLGEYGTTEQRAAAIVRTASAPKVTEVP